jgi:transcriptional regulator of met regulon
MGYWINLEKDFFKRNRILPAKLTNLVVNERRHRGVFSTMYRYNTEKLDEAFLYGDLYFDFDNKQDFEKVRSDAKTVIAYLKTVFRIQSDEIRIYFSGNKGVHIIVPAELIGIEPDKHLNGIYRIIAEDVKSFIKNKTLDLVIYDNKRLFRIPNSIHEATGLYKIAITYNELVNLSHEEIKQMAKQPRHIPFKKPKYSSFANTQYKRYVEKYIQAAANENKDIQYHGTLKVTPPCIEYLIENGAENGNRNNSIAVLSSFYRNQGKSLNETTSLIEDWNNKNITPTKASELKKTVKSVYTGKASYGCTSLKAISVCDSKKCPLIKKKAGSKQ